uniref:KIB1-4 beta-propeller domain-containing protein n=1 Tax=Aegilops tauschii TaxID=37682 RepID=M8C4T8_AEGTA
MCGPCGTGSCVLRVAGKAVKKRVGCPGGGWSAHPWRGNSVWDIAFYNGELYGLTKLSEILVKVKIVIKEDKTPEIMATHHLPIQSRNWSYYNPMYYGAYILELHGELLIAVREQWLSDHKYFFRVFKLADADNDKAHKHKWAQVTSFGEYALFLGWSRAVHVPVGGHHGIKRNHIYYYSPTTEGELPGDKVYSARTGDGDQVYCREDHSIDDGVGRTGHYLIHCYNNPTLL